MDNKEENYEHQVSNHSNEQQHQLTTEDPEIERSSPIQEEEDSAELKDDDLNQTRNPACPPSPRSPPAVAASPPPPPHNVESTAIKPESTEQQQQEENSNNKKEFGQDVLSFDSNTNHQQQQKSLFPPPSTSFPANIFDAPPSSMHLLKVKPLGMAYKEPHTIKEMIQPIPPDRSTFRGGLFNRFIHASHRRKHYDRHNTLTIADRVSPSSAGMQQQQGNSNTTITNNNNPPTSATSTQVPNLSLSSMPPREASTGSGGANNDLAADFKSVKSISLLAKGFGGGTRTPRRRLSTASSTANEKSYLDARQHVTPTKQLPYKGLLPDAGELYLVDLRASAKESQKAAEDIVIHGKSVVARRANNTSPVGVYTEMLRKTSPVTGKLAVHHQQMMEKMMEQSASASSSSLQPPAPQQQQQRGRRMSLSIRKSGGKSNSSKNATPSSPGGLSIEDAETSMMETSFLKSMIMLDPELAPGVVANRATKPPWAKAQQVEMSREELELLQMKNRKMFGKKKNTIGGGSPRFAAPTASRKKQLPMIQQTQITNRQNEETAADAAKLMELEKQNMLFPSQLRPEDRKEIEKRERAIKDQSRRHYLDEMVLARLAPAEREARLADREKLAPYRKANDRDLPFPEQAARDRLKHAKAKVPPLVLEGQLAIENITAYWKPRSPIISNPTSPTSFGAGGGNSKQSTSGLLISSLGIASTSGGTSQTARVGSGGDLPTEGAPKQKQPLTGREKHVEKANERVYEQEKELVEKYANLEARLQAKQTRAQKKVFS